jgi:acetyl-CoA synthetase
MWFPGYLDAPDKTAERFSPDGRYYLTGDLGREDDGLFYFASRDDDLIIMAGYRISPFDVESVLVTDPRVLEAAAIGIPDELRGEVLIAYVVLKDGVADHDALEHELQQLVKERFAAHAYPREVHVVEQLPKTPSGKVQRFVLRQQHQPA